MTNVLAAERPVDTQRVLIVRLSDQDAELAAVFLGHFGFEEIDCELHCERSLIGIDLAAEDPRFELREYRGGDPSLDGVIIDMHRRAYRGHSCVADLTKELLALRLANPSCYYKLLLHRGQLIGYASLWINGPDFFVDSLLVVRRHWGYGASDAFVHMIERAAVEHGCSKISTTASSRNRAVISLMDRLSYRAVKKTRRFACR